MHFQINVFVLIQRSEHRIIFLKKKLYNEPLERCDQRINHAVTQTRDKI